MGSSAAAVEAHQRTKLVRGVDERRVALTVLLVDVDGFLEELDEALIVPALRRPQ